MDKFLTSLVYIANELDPEWESLYDKSVKEIENEHKISIYYEVKSNLERSSIELRLLNSEVQDWYDDHNLRYSITDKLIRCLSWFISAK